MKHYLTRLEESVKGHWDSLCLCNYKGEEITFGEFATQVAKFHVFFQAAGIKKGDKIAICAKNSARWGVAFFAANTYEAVAVPILCDFNPDSVNHLVDHSESVILFTDNELWPKYDPTKMPLLKAAISTTDFTFLYSVDENIQTAMDQTEDLFKLKYPQGFTAKDVKYPTDTAKELAIINYTSGTTSDPKGVMIRYECVTSNVQYAIENVHCEPGYTMVSMLPMAHMYGMMFEFIYPMCCGATVYYLGRTPTPTLLLAAMAKVKPYLVVTVPLVMEKIFKTKIQPVLNKPVIKVLTKIPGVNQLIFKKIRTSLNEAFGGNIFEYIMGGAGLNPDVEKWFRKLKLPYTVGYGMTEAAPLMAYSDWRTFAPKSCGRVIDRAEVRIDSEDPQNVVGEIQVRGMNVMSGYYKNEEATKAAFTEDGWMNTGDLGVVDAQGNIFIRGRSKNMILSSNGQNIYPEEIEAILNNQDYILESVVVGRKGVLVGLVYPDSDKLKADGISGDALEAKMKEIVTLINKVLPIYSKLSKIELMDEPFIKTPKMSIKRYLYK